MQADKIFYLENAQLKTWERTGVDRTSILMASTRAQNWKEELAQLDLRLAHNDKARQPWIWV